MTLDLGALRVNKGNRAEAPWIGDARALTEADVAMLQADVSVSLGGKQTPLQRLTERHHTLARLLASGTPIRHASVITGYAAITISNLREDPTFRELIDFYAQDIDAEYLTMHSQLAGLGSDAIGELRKRVEDEPEKLGASFLLDVVTKIADRTGNGPSSTSKVEATVVIDLAEKMKAARMRAREAIEATAVDITPEPEA